MNENPTLTFLHGFLGTADDWRPLLNAPALHDLQSRSCCVELPPAEDWSAGTKHIAKTWEAASHGTILVGYSMGARIALGCAINEPVGEPKCEPPRIKGLVFISGQPGIDDAEKTQRQIHDAKICERIQALDNEQARRDFLQDWYQQPVFAHLSEMQITELVSSRLGFDAERQTRLLETYTVSRQPNYWPQLPDLTLPVLVVAGERDTKYVGVAERFAQTGCQATLSIVPNAGHNVQRENPAELADRIVRFVTTIGS